MTYSRLGERPTGPIIDKTVPYLDSIHYPFIALDGLLVYKYFLIGWTYQKGVTINACNVRSCKNRMDCLTHRILGTFSKGGAWNQTGDLSRSGSRGMSESKLAPWSQDCFVNCHFNNLSRQLLQRKKKREGELSYISFIDTPHCAQCSLSA